MDISSYTNSGQPRVAGKYLTRLANNGIAIVTYTSRISQVFSRVGNRRPWIELISSLITFLFSSLISNHLLIKQQHLSRGSRSHNAGEGEGGAALGALSQAGEGGGEVRLRG